MTDPEQAPQVYRHLLVWAVCALTAGIWYGLYSPGFPRLSISALLLYTFLFVPGILLLLIPLHFRFPARLPVRDIVLVLLVLFSFAGGVLRVFVYDRVQDRSLTALAGEKVRLTGIVVQEPQDSGTGKTVGFSLRACTAQREEGEPFPVSGSLRVYCYPEEERPIHRGDTVTFTARLKSPEGERFPGGFSTRAYLCRLGCRFMTYTKDLTLAETPVQPRGISYSIQSAGLALRESVLSSIDQSLGGYPEEAALLKGILMGDREDFSLEQAEAFRRSGLIHISAISGMHISFLYMLWMSFLARLRVPRWLIRILIFPILILYAAAVNFTPSICRAVIMLLLAELSIQLWRVPDPFSGLALAAAVLLLYNPYTLTSYGFLLSFGAALGLHLFAPPLTRILIKPEPKKKSALTRRRRFFSAAGRFALNSVGFSVACNLGIGYFSARFFNRLNWGSVLANIPILQLVSAAFLGGLIHWPLSLACPGLAAWLARRILVPILWLINRLVAFFSHSIFSISTLTPSRFGLVTYAAACGLFLLYLRQRVKKADQDPA